MLSETFRQLGITIADIFKPITELQEGKDGLSRLILKTSASTHEIVDLEKHQKAPNRIKHAVTLTSESAFVEYVKRFIRPETTVFIGANSFNAVLDYHDRDRLSASADGPKADSPSWCEHKATYSPAFSFQWKAWLELNKKPLSQVEFAQFLEERLDDIHTPAPAKVLEATLKFEQAQALNLGSSTNLDTGEARFQFTKDNVKTDVSFPHRFALRIPIYENQAPQEIECRFRYRVDNVGVLKLWYQFVRHQDELVRKNFENVVAAIRSKLPDVAFYEGK